jgi:ATP-dependent Clp protease ATP-binding subunit ClpA
LWSFGRFTGAFDPLGLVGGEIEEPRKSVLQDITKSSARAIILFIDDRHDLIGNPLHSFGSDSRRAA